MKTKKLGRVARFKARYGKRVKDKVLKVELEEFKLHVCPSCGFEKVKRKAAGIFECKKCNLKFAGGAYTPETMIGSTVKKIVSQKAFGAGLAELEKAKEARATAAVREEKPKEKERSALEEMKESLEKVKKEVAKEAK